MSQSSLCDICIRFFYRFSLVLLITMYYSCSSTETLFWVLLVPGFFWVLLVHEFSLSVVGSWLGYRQCPPGWWSYIVGLGWQGQCFDCSTVYLITTTCTKWVGNCKYFNRLCFKIPREDDVCISNGRLFHHLIDEKRNNFFMPISTNLR